MRDHVLHDCVHVRARDANGNHRFRWRVNSFFVCVCPEPVLANHTRELRTKKTREVRVAFSFLSFVFALLTWLTASQSIILRNGSPSPPGSSYGDRMRVSRVALIAAMVGEQSEGGVVVWMISSIGISNRSTGGGAGGADAWPAADDDDDADDDALSAPPPTSTVDGVGVGSGAGAMAALAAASQSASITFRMTRYCSSSSSASSSKEQRTHVRRGQRRQAGRQA